MKKQGGASVQTAGVATATVTVDRQHFLSFFPASLLPDVISFPSFFTFLSVLFCCSEKSDGQHLIVLVNPGLALFVLLLCFVPSAVCHDGSLSVVLIFSLHWFLFLSLSLADHIPHFSSITSPSPSLSFLRSFSFFVQSPPPFFFYFSSSFPVLFQAFRNEALITRCFIHFFSDSFNNHHLTHNALVRTFMFSGLEILHMFLIISWIK